MSNTRGGHSSADVFDRTERVYTCAPSADPFKPHLRRSGEGHGTWGAVRIPGVEIEPWPPEWRAAAYAFCAQQNRI